MTTTADFLAMARGDAPFVDQPPRAELMRLRTAHTFIYGEQKSENKVARLTPLHLLCGANAGVTAARLRLFIDAGAEVDARLFKQLLKEAASKDARGVWRLKPEYDVAA